jgi:hypothetical protein
VPREREIVRRCLTWLNEHPGCKARKLHGGPHATAGDPDIYGCYRGFFFTIECKQPGERPTRLQVHRLEEWAAAGARVAVVTNMREMDDWWQAWFGGAR